MIKLSEVKRLGLDYNTSEQTLIKGYGNGACVALGKTRFLLSVDDVTARVIADVVPDSIQEVPVLVGHPFTELPGVLVIKDDKQLIITEGDITNIGDIFSKPFKVKLWAKSDTIIPKDHLVNIKVEVKDRSFRGDVLVEASLRSKERNEYCIPRTILRIGPTEDSVLPIINLADCDFVIGNKKLLARAWPCVPSAETETVQVLRMAGSNCPLLPVEEINVGPVTPLQREDLIQLLQNYRDCFSKSATDVGCAKSAEMKIILNDESPFTYRPYRMSASQQEVVKEMVKELLESGIIRYSNSPYSSPILLVKKKNGEERMCVDYRKLNSLTVKEQQPLPRIDDQLDRLHGSVFFSSLDLRSGYYQIPVEEGSKQFTAFVTPEGQYEFNRMPFGLTNAPRVFQRFMNKILALTKAFAAVYLDDVLIHAKTIEDAMGNLETILKLLREEGLTLNLSKCYFLQLSITYLGFEISDGKVKPGSAKIKAIEEFPLPKTIHNIRQFIGLTGYFRHFVNNYATIALPLTNLLKKNVSWKWGKSEQGAFDKLRDTLMQQPILAIFNPGAHTEVHTDASAFGVAGILLQKQADDRLHPIAYYSRQTNKAESKYHSFELETLAVVESLKKFRVYLLGIHFTVVTDCNAIKASSTKKDILPRIARWWLQLQDFDFTVQYRPGNRLKHVDALSRNPAASETAPEEVLRIEPADWVLSGQLTDEKLKLIREVLLKKRPETDYDKSVFKNYALRDGRIYRITVKGLLWVVPRGMRQQIVKLAHDDKCHFAAEKTLQRLCEHYWFPRMREYVQKYIACCIPCLYSKRPGGKKEGLMHPIEKIPIPLHMLHIDHVGPFPKSRRGNVHLLVVVDAFTKFVFLKPVKSTKTKFVIDYLQEIYGYYGHPHTIVSDQGSAFTSAKFKSYCQNHNIKHVRNAVATPRANGQVERLNRTIKGAILATTTEENRWDENIREIQLTVNTTVSKTTGKTPTELFYGYKPRSGADVPLLNEISEIPKILEDLPTLRNEVAKKIAHEQSKQKLQYDKRRKSAKQYKEGDLVLIEKQGTSEGTSRKLVLPYAGPMVIKAVLPNDRYLVTDMPNSHRTAKATRYEKVIAVDRMKAWIEPGGVSDETDNDSGEDGVELSPDDSSSEESEHLGTR